MIELCASGNFLSHFGLVISLALLMAVSGLFQLHLINLAMKYYAQIEAIPVYQTAVMILWLVTGMVVFDEV